MSNDEFLLESASTLAPQVDQAMLGLLIICGSALLLILLLVIGFSSRYRKDSPHARKLERHGSLPLEWGWAIGSMVIFLGLFAWGITIFFAMHVEPSGAEEISVVGKQWMWKFQHPNGKREINELHIPVGQAVVLKMISQDVIHSLFLPSFRLKQDVLPGRYTRAWFEASRIGRYHIFCTQYCGTMHAQMIGRVVVMSATDYDRWLVSSDVTDDRVLEETSESRGQKLFTKFACISCHAEGTEQLGPSLNGLFGSKVKLSTGKTIFADDNYIRESILYPNAKIVFGYQPVMPSFLGRMNEEDLLDLLAYIKSLGQSNAQKASTK
ncbi:MAG TPA: cytochrome c oxidase subunit II [Myxococcota bacterium]|nr:cytochrome c oxidase subunit II [Myxococcota bacterium]